MNRAEFEKRLREDPELRERLDNLQETARRLRELADLLGVWRRTMFDELMALAEEGVPLSSLARVVGVTPQRVNQIRKEAAERVATMQQEGRVAAVDAMAEGRLYEAERTIVEALRQGLER